MLKEGLLLKFGIKIPAGKVCTGVKIMIPGKQGKLEYLETITDAKRLEKRANKIHGTILRPVFVKASDPAEAI